MGGIREVNGYIIYLGSVVEAFWEGLRDQALLNYKIIAYYLPMPPFSLIVLICGNLHVRKSLNMN